MESCKQQTIDGFNEQVNAIKKNAWKGGKTDVSLFKFGSAPDSRPQEVYFEENVSELEKLTSETYQPFGNTPMYDAIGMALNRVEALDQKGNVGFLVVVVSDGQENASSEFTSAAIAERTKRLQATGKYTFVYIGANQDLTKVQQTFGFAAGNMRAYAATPVGTATMWQSNAISTAAYFTSVRGMDSCMTTEFTCLKPDMTSSVVP